MEPNDKKLLFIKLRAEGLSYSKIAAALKISKSTCTAWNKELSNEIAELKREHLEELHKAYHMTKTARIEQLGESLNSINNALEQADLSEVAPEKLLGYKLKYLTALKEEYTGEETPYMFSNSMNPKEIVEALGDLLNRIRSGDITMEQASRESLVLSNLLKAYDAVELKEKLDALEAILGGRN